MQSCGDSSSKIPILKKRLEELQAKKDCGLTPVTESKKRKYANVVQESILPSHAEVSPLRDMNSNLCSAPSSTLNEQTNHQSSKDFSSLLFVEVFSGTGGLTAAVKRL